MSQGRDQASLSGRGHLVLWLLAAAFLVGACGRTARPTVTDVALVFAVRTALVNDPAVGAIPIRIDATDGVVRLEGQVASEAERARVVELASAVPGVRRVEARIVVSGAGMMASPPMAEVPADRRRDRPRRSALASAEDDPPPRLVAVGGGIGLAGMQNDGLDGGYAVGPVFRFGRGGGWGPAFVFGSVKARVEPAAGSTTSPGDFRSRLTGFGLGYGVRSPRWSVRPALVLGYSGNSVRLRGGIEVGPDDRLPVSVDGSFFVLPSTTLWFETSRRVSVGVSVGYLVNRPVATWLRGQRSERQRLDADALVTGVSLAWWVF